MLWKRVLTAVVLVPLVVFGTYFLQTPIFSMVLAALVLVGAWEMARLANVQDGWGQAAYVTVVALTLTGSWFMLRPDHLTTLQAVMALWWMMTTLSLVFRRRGLERVEAVRPMVLLAGGLVMLAAWQSVIALHGSGETGPVLVLLLFVVIWLADSGAYFAGMAFGKRKLSPYVSPGKTWAGVGGAVAATLSGGLLLLFTGWAEGADPLAVLTLTVVVTMVSIGGDLWESRLKREAGVKDSGNLLPGHGGMLDRIDSLLAAAPVFGLGIHWSGVGG
jgi:phosphatidate cytidylyltransferase